LGLKGTIREKAPPPHAPLLQLPLVCAEQCTVWRCHAGGAIDSSSCVPGPFEIVVPTSFMSACIAHTVTASAILHCYSVECTWLIGAPLTLLKLYSVADRWKMQETLHRGTFKGGEKTVVITFVPTFEVLTSLSVKAFSRFNTEILRSSPCLSLFILYFTALV